MRFSDIKVGYIYNVIFDPVRECEFNGKHLAVVLKKNNDSATFIVMPLTSAPNGTGVNKIRIGQINNLPQSLKSNDTYAVFNQVRTINANRFISLKEGTVIKECRLDKPVFYKLLGLAIHELVYNLNQDDRIAVLKSCYENALINKAKDMAYQIIKLRNTEASDEGVIFKLLQQIKETISDISYSLDKKLIDDGVGTIFDEAKKL